MAKAMIKKDIAVAQAEPKIPYLGINKIFRKIFTTAPIHLKTGTQFVKFFA